MKQYEVFELVLNGQLPEGSEALAQVNAVFTCDGQEKEVKGFYDGNGVYKVRFLPEKCGTYFWKVSGAATAEGSEECVPGEGHGLVRAEKTHFVYEDGTRYIPFGTTIVSSFSSLILITILGTPPSTCALIVPSIAFLLT